MHLECGGEREWSAQEIALGAEAAKKAPLAPHPWEELEEWDRDLRVAERMGKGASIQDARALPMWTWCELLILSAAHNEAMPAQMERAREEADRKAKERADANTR